MSGEPQQLQAEIDRLRQENAELRQRLGVVVAEPQAAYASATPERPLVAPPPARITNASLVQDTTAKTNPNAVDQAKKVICVYTYDWQDREDVMRIRAEFRALGIGWKIPYKADVDSEAGRYRVAGHTRISKYYECKED